MGGENKKGDNPMDKNGNSLVFIEAFIIFEDHLAFDVSIKTILAKFENKNWDQLAY